MVEKIKREQSLIFDFVIETDDGKKIHFKKGNELMDVIINWAEENNCQVGGGYRFSKKNEFNADKIFSILD